jgi:hypothetical protein
MGGLAAFGPLRRVENTSRGRIVNERRDVSGVGLTIRVRDRKLYRMLASAEKGPCERISTSCGSAIHFPRVRCDPTRSIVTGLGTTSIE